MQVLMHPLTLNSKLAPLRTSHNTLLSAENERSHVAHAMSWWYNTVAHKICHVYVGYIMLHMKDAILVR